MTASSNAPLRRNLGLRNPIDSKQLDRLLGAATEKKAAAETTSAKKKATTAEITKSKDQQSDYVGNRNNTSPGQQWSLCSWGVRYLCINGGFHC